MLAASVCPLLEALVLSARDASLSAAVGASLALILLEQTIGFTLGMGAGSFVSRCIGQGTARGRPPRRLHGVLRRAGAFRPAFGGRAFSPRRFCACSARRRAPSPPVCLTRRLRQRAAAVRRAGAEQPAARAGENPAEHGRRARRLGAGRGAAAASLRPHGLGAFGAGMAMLAREAATLAVLLAYTLRHGELIRPSLRRVRLTRAVFSEIMRSGLPTLLRQGATSVSAALLSPRVRRVRRARSGGHGALRPRDHAVHLGRHRLRSRLSAGLRRGLRRKNKRRAVEKPIASVSASRLRFLLAAGLAFFIFAPALAAVSRRTRNPPRPRAARLASKSVAFPAQSAVILMTMLTQAMGLTLRASLVATSRQALFFLPCWRFCRVFSAFGGCSPARAPAIWPRSAFRSR